MSKDFFSKTYFDELLRTANPDLQEMFRHENEYLEKIEPNKKVLDVGCGFGRHIKILAPFSIEVVGIDKNDDMIKRAENNLHEFSSVKLFCTDAKNLENLKEDYFDYVICMENTFGVLGGIKEDVLKEMKRVVSPKGKIILSMYNDKALETRIESYKRLGLHIEKINNGIIYCLEGIVTEQFSKKQLEEIFTKFSLKSKIISNSPVSFLCELNK